MCGQHPDVLIGPQGVGQPGFTVLRSPAGQQRGRIDAQTTGRRGASDRGDVQLISAHTVTVQPAGDELPRQLVGGIRRRRQAVRMRTQVDDDPRLQRVRARRRRRGVVLGFIAAPTILHAAFTLTVVVQRHRRPAVHGGRQVLPVPGPQERHDQDDADHVVPPLGCVTGGHQCSPPQHQQGDQDAHPAPARRRGNEARSLANVCCHGAFQSQ